MDDAVVMNPVEGNADEETPLLSEEEVRVLGCMMEKEVTTPEYYPMSLNSLKNACNQKSSREPVVFYDDNTVEDGVFSLREKLYACRTSSADSRVAKYKHTLHNHYDLSEAERAVMCLLFLRGPQTLGELRGRSGRLYEFRNIDEVGEVMDTLMHHAKGALVTKLPRESGRKEPRYAHLLCGPIDFEALLQEAAPAPEPREPRASVDEDALTALKGEMESLREDVAQLRREFAEFKKQFD